MFEWRRNEKGSENTKIKVDDNGDLRFVLPRRVALSLLWPKVTQTQASKAVFC